MKYTVEKIALAAIRNPFRVSGHVSYSGAPFVQTNHAASCAGYYNLRPHLQVSVGANRPPTSTTHTVESTMFVCAGRPLGLFDTPGD